MKLSASRIFYSAHGIGLVGFLPSQANASQISAHSPQNNSYTPNLESKIPKKEDTLLKDSGTKHRK